MAMAAMIPLYAYDNCKGPYSRYVIKLYDYVDYENGKDIYYTVCCMLGEGKSLYEEPIIVRLLTDIIKTCSIIGSLNSLFVSKLIRKSFRRDNQWQREETDKISDVAFIFEQLSITL